MEADRDALIRELKALRPYAGLTLAKLAEAPNLLAALGNRPLQEAKDLIKEKIERLPDADLLLNAFRFDESLPRSLVQRRKRLEYTEKYQVSVASIELYEDAVIEKELVPSLTDINEPVQAGSSVSGGLELDFRVQFARGYVDASAITLRRSSTTQAQTIGVHRPMGGRCLVPLLIFQIPQNYTPDLASIEAHCVTPTLDHYEFQAYVCAPANLWNVGTVNDGNVFTKPAQFADKCVRFTWRNPDPRSYYCLTWKYRPD